MIEAAPGKVVEPVRRLVTKKIEEVRPGDVVVSRDERTGEITRQQVLDAYQRVTDHLRVVEIAGADGETQRIETTNEHPFWVTNRGWVNAEDLSEGDPLEDSSGGVAWIASTTLEPHPEGIAVYNFQVDQTHTYFVRAHGIRGPPLFVHNADCGVDDAVTARRAYLNQKFGRSGNLDADISSGRNYNFNSDGSLSQYGAKRYSRGSFRAGVVETVWENAPRYGGRVQDWKGNIVLKGDRWDMGHRFGYEHWKHQRSAAMRNITRGQFLDEFNNPNHYRVESPAANQGHFGESPKFDYVGDGSDAFYDWREMFGIP